MRRYDITGVRDFLICEIGTTPEEMKAEIEDAMAETDPGTPLWHTLLTLADLMDRIEESF